MKLLDRTSQQIWLYTKLGSIPLQKSSTSLPPEAEAFLQLHPPDVVEHARLNLHLDTKSHGVYLPFGKEIKATDVPYGYVNSTFLARNLSQIDGHQDLSLATKSLIIAATEKQRGPWDLGPNFVVWQDGNQAYCRNYSLNTYFLATFDLTDKTLTNQYRIIRSLPFSSDLAWQTWDSARQETLPPPPLHAVKG